VSTSNRLVLVVASDSDNMPTSTTASPASTATGGDCDRVYLWSACLVVALGRFMYGYDWVVISGADIFYEKYFNLTSATDIGWAKSCALVGCLAGSLMAGALSDHFGRRRLLFLSAVLFIVSALATGGVNTFSQFVFWRVVGGMAVGITTNLTPMYIAEIAPAAIRGKLLSMNQLNIVIGMVLAEVVNWLVAQPIPASATAVEILNSWNGQHGWRWMFCLEFVPALFFLIGLFFVPESPRWLIKNGQSGSAQKILARLGGENSAARMVADIESTLVNEIQRVNFRDLFEPRVWRIVVFGALLAFIVQWCGINVIFYYTKDVFVSAGYHVSGIMLNIIVVGAANLIFTFVAIQMADRVGRRLLTLIGWAGLGVIFLVMGFYFHAGVTGLPVVLLVVAAIGWYASTIAPMSWVTLAEIFPNRIRGAAMAMAVSALWVGNFTLTYFFPSLLARLGMAGTFWVFAAICTTGFVLMKAKLPETKGKTLEQIERELVD